MWYDCESGVRNAVLSIKLKMPLKFNTTFASIAVVVHFEVDISEDAIKISSRTWLYPVIILIIRGNLDK
jgi:hypothetical protein